jgi:hypothetical protein
MEEALKAGHVLEPDRDMQFCAEVTEVDNASSVNRSDFCIVDLFVYLGYVLEDRLCSRSRKQVKFVLRIFHGQSSILRPTSLCCPALVLLSACC